MILTHLTLFQFLGGASALVRLYFPESTASAVNPAFDAAWQDTDGTVRRKLAHIKGASAMTTGTRIVWTAGQKALDRQYVSQPLAAGQTFTTALTVKMQILARQQPASTANVDQPLLGVRIVDSAGTTVRATLFTVAEWNTASVAFNVASRRNVSYATGQASNIGSPYTTASGDRLVVEIGYTDSTGTTPEAEAKWGETGTDLPVDETTTADRPGWIEFSQAIAFVDESAASNAIAMQNALFRSVFNRVFGRVN